MQLYISDQLLPVALWHHTHLRHFLNCFLAPCPIYEWCDVTWSHLLALVRKTLLPSLSKGDFKESGIYFFCFWVNIGYHIPLGNQGWKPNKTHRTESSPKARVEPISVREKIKQSWNEIIQLIPPPFFFFCQSRSLALPVGILIPFSSGCWLLIYRYS